MSVSVTFDVVDHLSFSMAHNRFPVFSRLEVHNGPEGVQEARIVVEVRDHEGLVSVPWSLVADLAPSATLTLTDVKATLDPNTMWQVEDERPARVVVRVMAGDDELAASFKDVRLLPANHWRSMPPGLAFELLPSFVLPNDPSIARLLEEASHVLQRETGSSSMEGYQSGTDRVDQMVAAIWTAARARNVRYAEAPASWGSIGQKVRTPAEVLDRGIGTCLDTTLVLAAALEQGGVRPLLWVLDGHALLGYWREEAALDANAVFDGSEVINDVDRGRMRLVETTAVTQVDSPVSLRDAHRLALSKLHDLEVVQAVVDVWVSRHNGVLPLPVRRRSADGVEIHEYREAARPPLTVVVQGAARPDTLETRADVPARVQLWKNALLDLTLRNRLINYTTRSGISLVVPEDRLGTIEDVVSAGRPITLRPADSLDQVDIHRGMSDARQLPPERLDEALVVKGSLYTDVLSGAYATRLRGIAYKARTIVEETGANNLYLALGSLVWSIDGKSLRSPLVLVPVTLVAPGRGLAYRIQLDETGSSTPNYCLLEKLRMTHGLEIPLLENPETDESGIDLTGSLRAVRDALASKGLPFRVEETADLAILQFAKFRLWKDLDENWAALAQNSLVHHLVHTPTEEFQDPAPSTEVDLDALDHQCPIPADASQLSAVAEAVQGRTFVLEGPPGTGKSQTITNLLTRAVAEGKRVLFVAEKRAALDVVQARLDSVGMGPFSLDLHDRGSKPAAVRAQIKAAMDHVVDVDEQELAIQSEDLRASGRTLGVYAARLHEQNAVGLSYYSARTQLLTLGKRGPRFDVPSSLLTPQAGESLGRARGALRLLGDVAEPAQPRPDHPWAFVRTADVTSLDAIRDAASAVDAATNAVVTYLEDPLLLSATTPEQLSVASALLQRPAALADIDRARTPQWRDDASRLVTDLESFTSSAHPGLDSATPEALTLRLHEIHAEAVAAAAAGFFRRGKRQKAVLARLQPVLRAGSSISHKRVQDLTGSLVSLQDRLIALRGRADSLAGVQVPQDWNPLAAQPMAVRGQVDHLMWASDAVVAQPGAPAAFVDALRQRLSGGAGGDPRLGPLLGDLATAWTTLRSVAGTSSEVIAAWSSGRGLVHTWLALRDEDLPEAHPLKLRRWLAFNAALEPLSAAGLHHAVEVLRTGEVHYEDAVRALERGLAVASVTERARATGLDAFDPVAHGRAVSRFALSAKKVRSGMTHAIPDAVVRSRTFDSTSSRGLVGELQRELAKQRRALGVRALIQRYGDLITQLMPCVLVSPDSVARFFPVGSQVFDIVVFDEASQIRVADAVGAMGRGRSVVVVGDSKQMPPTTFGESLLADDDRSASLEDEVVVEDTESILTEAVSARVPQRWLTWHYRSKDESLIAFSNIRYYDGKLSSFPSPAGREVDRLAEGRGISLVRVQGKFHRSGPSGTIRTNPVEAQAIVDDLRRRFYERPGVVPSVGVVTFNLQQRTLIEAMIRDSGDERMVAALDEPQGEGLFVKNLENVQGDERDVILFSTAFSVNDKGVLPLNFGPLTRAGGERRLNVAVTRARRQVVLYSSFDPSQLRVDETQSVGIRHLREYLELAQRGPADWAGSNPAVRAVPDRHRDELAAALAGRRMVVTKDVGLSEFRVDIALARSEAPEEPVVAVLLDGPGWASRRTVGDRDGLPIQVLDELMHWPVVERVWMPEWTADPEAVLDRLERATRDAAVASAGGLSTGPVAAPHEPTSNRVVGPALGRSEDTVQRPEDPAALRGGPPAVAPRALAGEVRFEPFFPRSVGGRDVLDQLPSASASRKVSEVIRKVVASEGPVHPERLARLVASCFDLSRLNQLWTETILAATPRDLPRDPKEKFVWPAGSDPRAWSEFRRGVERSLEHVSLREIGNAMVSLSRSSAGMTADELDSEAVAVFGGKRRTAGISARLKEARNLTVKEGRLTLEVSGLYVPS